MGNTNRGVKEATLQEQVATYLRLQYPDVMFHSDFGSGVRLTPSQAAKQKRQNGGQRAWPDMFIAHPRCDEGVTSDGYSRPFYGGLEISGCGFGDDWIIWSGLFLELKREGVHLRKKNGEWATTHIAEQSEVLKKLRERGYVAEFAVGFDEAKKIIDKYLRR